MKKPVCIFLAFLVAIACCLAFSACGSSFTKAQNATVHKFGGDAEEGDFAEPEDSTTMDMSENDSTNKDSSVQTNRKIIETINLSLQTKEFDSLMDKINMKVSELGGYVESSEIEGREINSEENRWAEITLRIPSDKSGKFGDYISKNSVVVNRSVSTEDVTLKYVDSESRVKALEAEKKSLENLLENAESVDDIITIRGQLTDVIYEIERMKSQLRTYDNLIDYTTVSITVDEVERTEIVEKQTVWLMIATNLKYNSRDVWSIFVSMFFCGSSGTNSFCDFIFSSIYFFACSFPASAAFSYQISASS